MGKLVKAFGAAILVIVAIVSVSCNKSLPSKNGADAGNKAKAPVKNIESSQPGASPMIIALPKAEIELDESVDAVGYAPSTTDQPSSQKNALINAREHLAYAMLPSNVGFQKILNAYEVHVQQQVAQGEVSFEPAGAYIKATIKAQRPQNAMELFEKMTYYMVVGDAAYSDAKDVSQMLPMAHRKAYSAAFVQGVEAYAKATKMTSGLITVGKVVKDLCEKGMCRVELAIAFSPL